MNLDEFNILGLDEPELPPVAPLAPLELAYPPLLPKDLAVAPNRLTEILAHYGVSLEQYVELTENLAFRRDLSRWQKEVREGNTLKFRAGAYAEELLPDLHTIFKGEDTPSTTKVKIMELLLGIAGVTTKAEPAPMDSTAKGQAINIQINLG